jgi:spore coat protein JB
MDKNRTELLNKISKCNFVLNDLNLYLDTHPNDKQALKMYGQYQRQSSESVAEYEKMYGPLTPGLTNRTDTWNWIDGPWPWENQYNGGEY